MNPTVYLIDQLQSDVERLTRANTELTSENAKLRAALVGMFGDSLPLAQVG